MGIDGGSVDGLVVNRAASWVPGRIWRPGHPDYAILGFDTRVGIVLGSTLCRSGWNSGEDCGTLVSRNATEGNLAGLGLVANAVACGGDSGGPWFRPSANAGVGVHVDSELDEGTDCSPLDPTEDSWLSFMSEITADLPFVPHVYGGLPQMFARRGDDAVWQSLWNGATWVPVSLGGVATSSPTAVYSGFDRLDVFVRSTGDGIWQRFWTASQGWSSWLPVGGVATSAPDAASPGAGSFPRVFVRGPDNALWQMTWTGTGWSLLNLGGVCTSGPAAAFSGPNRLDVFCRRSDDAIWQRFWIPAGGWSGWVPVGGVATSDPDAASPGPGGFPDVFVRGTDNAIWQLEWNKFQGRWLLRALGGDCASGPGAAYTGAGRVDVFCRGTDGAAHQNIRVRQPGSDNWGPWLGWRAVGHTIFSDPDAAAPVPA
jgi:hypothetical protein